MNIVTRLSGAFVVGLAVVAAAMSIGGDRAHAAGETIDCSIPLNVVCDISHPDGIANVTVAVDFGPELGVIDVVDENFNCQTEVTIHWDPIVANADIQVTPCEGFKFKSPDGDDGGFGGRLVLVGYDDPTAPARFDTASSGPVVVDSYAAPGKTMEICHLNRDGSIKVMTILAANWPAHDAHGDGTVFGHTADGGVVCLFIG